MNSIVDNYNKLLNQMQAICTKNHITYPINLVAVSKTFLAKDIADLYTNSQHIHFGENYPLELNDKSTHLIQYPLQWHFIGNIQSNKIKYIAKSANWVHSIYNLKHILLLNKLRNGLPKLNVLIQVNISSSINKLGVSNFTEIIELAQIIKGQENLTLRGLMGMSGTKDSIDTKNQQFRNLKILFDQLNLSGLGQIDTLSMGMSDDFELALTNGANMLRIGSLIFGKRN